MDGTLLDDNKNLSSDFWTTEEKLHNKGVKFAIASGRQYYNLLSIFEKIKDRCIFIAENGALVMQNEKRLHLETIKNNEVYHLINIGRKVNNADIIFCGLKSAYIENDKPELWEYAGRYYKKLQLVSNLDNVKDDCLKITMCDYIGSQENSYEHFKNEQSFKVAVSGTIWLDITSKNANKGNAIKGIQEKLNISYDETMVFGDYLNDLEMMKTGKYSYAMKNAKSQIIEAANFQTEYTNNDNGVLKTIDEYFFNKI